MKSTNKEPGRIFRVKSGYNPNSSSVGSQIPTFLFFAVGTGAIAVIISQTINMVNFHIRLKKNDSSVEKSE